MKFRTVVFQAASSRAASLLCAAALSFTPAAHAQQPFMTKNVHQAVTDGQVQLLHPLPLTQLLKLSIALPLRDEADLDSLLKNLYDPQSPQFHQWLSVPEFTDRFGPTTNDLQTLTQFAQAHGLVVTSIPTNRRLINVEGSVASINQAFHITLQVYQHPTENRTFFAPDREPTADLPIKLWHIEGLDTFSLPRPRLQQANAAQLKSLTTGSGPSGQFLGSDFRTAYYGGTALTGAGQSIGLYGLPYNLSDVQRYYNNVGQSFNASILKNYSTDGTVNVCNSGCDDTEPVIDIIASLSMAPGVGAVIEYFGNNPMDTFNAMASANAAKQLSVSIGYYPADSVTEEPIFKEMAAQGQSIFVASGDSGAYKNSDQYEFPGDDPYVVSVGGTDLTTNGKGGPWISETAWVGSSGGPNNQSLPIPSYQQQAGVITAANGGSTTLRNAPDVAMEANTDNWFCANNQACSGGLGGTSFAAPRWAGFLALVNQQAAQNGQAAVGFLNPLIYGIGTGPTYNTVFHDITNGNNANGTTAFNAVTGYDLVTGWGSPKGQAFIDALAPPTAQANLNGTHLLGPQNAPGSLLDDWQSNTAAGNQIDIYPANGTGAQSWVFSNAGVSPAGAYNIASSYGPYCLTASGTNWAAPVQLNPCNGTPAQSWTAVPTTGGRYLFHPATDSTLCLDVRGASTAPATIVQVYGCNGTVAQAWALQ